ncbi:hypothetical protein FVQ98_15020 [Ottowia sp. GY511]|uniref:DUF4148 domain-containing protein n=1 Tax=Ottowia flava TaxID=2675430 RepID=A0ABW4KY81_9BURK|nr:hypothetical protein [Ottowia sp. GY511]TXK26278.1 hypothetical protein FVQ98_15020 [Ottowia sp. GY511]
MTTRFASLAAAAALSALFAGNAMAQMPASGEGPLFLNEAKSASTTTREAVRQEAIAQTPASGALDGSTVATQANSQDRSATAQAPNAQGANQTSAGE